MFKKIVALGAAAALCVGLMSGCGAASTTATNGYSAENPLVLTLATACPRPTLSISP